ncbi:uncharacterized protein LOC111395668 isoform X3 [Olea europaea var. sylvestris]|uniref:uncharacterized protein LOC111395668 isoform X3 n=1 Tax=Olea europaea var. sylvestris TaxID=158386 RepID=UPI000C1CF19A|nr:uncharacterized protein LOC111395668 isoform X3 [Olea europaea var. sylvestris]
MRANSLCSPGHHFCRFHSPSDLLCNFPIHSLYSVPIISVPVIISKSLQYRYSISRVQRSKIQMGCRKEGLGEDANSKAAMAASVSDALLLATMCIIGLPVDVHAKDGSVYSGVFHTASVDNDYAIVLKKARMIKKGNRGTNVMNGSLIETLIVQSEDLVQVVAKGVPLPANGITGYVWSDSVEDIADINECLKREVKATEPNESNGDKMHKSQTRSSAKKENGFDCISTAKKANATANSLRDFSEKQELLAVSVDGRQVGDGSQDKQRDCRDKLEFLAEKTSNEVRGLSIGVCETQSTAAESIPDVTNMQRAPTGVSSACPAALDYEMQGRPSLEETQCSEVPASDVSVAATSTVDIASESLLSSSFTSTHSVPTNLSSFNRTAKESKLNPGAKIFTPSLLHHRSVTPPAVPSLLHHRSVTPPVVPTGATVAYLPDHHAMVPIATAQQEVDISSPAPRSAVPVKFVQCGNVVIGNGGTETPYVQPFIGQVVSRMQPVRPAYVHSNPQNVMLGRVGPLVCMHPISNGAAGFSQATMRPLLTPHHLPKHQGSATAQALQLCVNPPIIASGQQPFTIPSPMPISQPYFPVIPVPRSNGFFGTKFA